MEGGGCIKSEFTAVIYILKYRAGKVRRGLIMMVSGAGGWVFEKIVSGHLVKIESISHGVWTSFILRLGVWGRKWK